MVRLTEEEIRDAVRESDIDWHTGWTLDEDAPNRYVTFARAIEAAVLEKLGKVEIKRGDYLRVLESDELVRVFQVYKDGKVQLQWDGDFPIYTPEQIRELFAHCTDENIETHNLEIERMTKVDVEPVAYSYTSRITGAQGFSHHPLPRYIDPESWEIKPLYLHPSPPPEQESVCPKCKGLGYYDEGHENDDGSMSGGNYVECDKCKKEPKDVNLTHTHRQHVTDGQQCWCNPDLDYKDPVTGAEVWIHKEPQ